MGRTCSFFCRNEQSLLYESIDENAAVIEATFGPRGIVAFAITRDGIKKSSQGPTRNVDIWRPIMMSMQILREMTGYSEQEEENRTRRLNQLSKYMSDILLLPFAETIRSNSHVTFSSSDPLTAFRFLILLFDEKPLIMHAAVSQVPSMTVLFHLSQQKSEPVAPTVSVLAKSPTEELSSATRGGTEINLHMAGIEAVNIGRLFATWPIEASLLGKVSKITWKEDIESCMLGLTETSITAVVPFFDLHGAWPRFSRCRHVCDSEYCEYSRFWGLSEWVWKGDHWQRSFRVLSCRFEHWLSGIHWVIVGGERFWLDVSDDNFLSAIEEKSGGCCGGTELVRQAQLDLFSLDSDRANVLSMKW